MKNVVSLDTKNNTVTVEGALSYGELRLTLMRKDMPVTLLRCLIFLLAALLQRPRMVRGIGTLACPVQ